MAEPRRLGLAAFSNTRRERYLATVVPAVNLAFLSRGSDSFPSSKSSISCKQASWKLFILLPLSVSDLPIVQPRFCAGPAMPKRSHGCFECRKRKVRCDQTKPECNTCRRRGTKCPGYRPTQAFILHTFDKRSERPGIIKEDENRYRYANHAGLSGHHQAVVQLPPSAVRPLDAPVPRPVSQLAIDRLQFLSSFLTLYLPKWEGDVLTPPSAMMLYLPSVPSSSKVFLAALDAVSMAQLAVDNKNNPLIYRSRSLYGTALSQLMTAITDPDSSLQDETLLATYLLGLYEVG